jgi:calcium/proton exchanger cax
MTANAGACHAPSSASPASGWRLDERNSVGVAEGTGKALGMSQIFIGIVFLAIIGGAAESVSAIALARKDKMDLSVGIAVGSSIQIALFLHRCSKFAAT